MLTLNFLSYSSLSLAFDSLKLISIYVNGPKRIQRPIPTATNEMIM